MRTVVVTGGSGFIGSNLIRRLLKENVHVVNIDCLTYAGVGKNLEDVLLHPNYRHFKVDIRDEDTLLSVVTALHLTEDDYVLHLAAESHVDRSIHNPNIFLETNGIGTLNMLNLLRAGVIPNLLYMSTDEVYGSQAEGEYAVITSRMKPSSPYAASKAAADLLCQAYVRTYGVDVTIVRPANNYGIYQHPEKLVPNVLSKIIRGEDIIIHGSGKQLRDWLSVEDTCEFLWHAASTDEMHGGIFNLPGTSTYSVLEVIDMLTDISNASFTRRVHTADRPGQDCAYHMTANTDQFYGWEPKHTLKDDLATIYDWYANNEKWWNPLLESK